ncbi:hypothetical protein N9164_15705 [Draconibacterium sp.]|nr:hypothetical protein [Draconibacterium sp.]
MNASKALFWRLGIAGTALIVAVAIYCLARIYPPELLAPFKITISILAGQPGLFGSAPSFFYTFAIGLIVGTFASSPASAKLHCLNWLGLAVLLEISQHPIIAKHLASWLADTLSVSTWEIISPYWNRGVFDPLDLIATVVGGLTVLALLTYFPTEFANEHL